MNLGAFNLTGLPQFSLDDPDLLRAMVTPGQYFNWARFTNPLATQLIYKAEATEAPSQRLALYDQAQEIIMNEAAMLPVRYNEDLKLVASNLHGLVVTKCGFIDYYSAYFQ
jgi:ABC-type transport system substrate-binding protein